jgi:hypothetical protein
MVLPPGGFDRPRSGSEASLASGVLSRAGLPSFRALAYVPLMPPKICPEARRALLMLSESPEGCTESLMLLQGFKSALIAVLVGTGLATAKTEYVPAEGGQVEVTLLHITDAGKGTLGQG